MTAQPQMVPQVVMVPGAPGMLPGAQGMYPGYQPAYPVGAQPMMQPMPMVCGL